MNRASSSSRRRIRINGHTNRSGSRKALRSGCTRNVFLTTDNIGNNITIINMVTALPPVLPRCRLHIYRGHEKACPHRSKKRGINTCRCTWWVDGVIKGKRVNKSLGTRNKGVAEERLLHLELSSQAPQGIVVTPALAEACDQF